MGPGAQIRNGYLLRMKPVKKKNNNRKIKEMPFTFVDGNCVLFNTGSLMVEDNYLRNCSSLAPVCPDFYTSTESYKCK
jgi:hypothetical protein